VTSLPALVVERTVWKAEGRRVAFTNGCFDILHPGHVALLEAARSTADILVVGLNSDRSVGAIKGPSRPVIPEAERAETLLALEAVDRVVVYGEPTPLEVISRLLPDVLVKGADWSLESIVGRDLVAAAGGRVLRVPLLPGRSTTAILDRIRCS
jgi:rfaE bifunctional protein nucleotidyltransferase chain/domain